MRQRLILHIGTHKTGSTTIQNYFYLNRLWLRPMGIYYPKPINGPLFYANNHKDLRDTARIEGKSGGIAVHERFGPHADLLAEYVNRIKRVGAPVSILSCEGWSSILNCYAHRLSALTSRFDVKVIAFMRRPDLWVESFYRQRVANLEHREQMPFRQFIAQPPMKTYLYDRSQLFRWWEAAFGREALTVIPYEPSRPGFDLLGKFFDAADIPTGPVRHLLFRRASANRTLLPNDAERLRRLHARGERPRKRPRRRDNAVAPCYLAPEERAHILRDAADDMEQICRAYVRDGRQVLFPGNPERIGPVNDLREHLGQEALSY